VSEYRPVRTLADLLTLNAGEVTGGYRLGALGYDEPLNTTRSVWHGWRCGAFDAGKIERDDAMRELLAEIAAGNAAPPKENPDAP